MGLGGLGFRVVEAVENDATLSSVGSKLLSTAHFSPSEASAEASSLQGAI